MLKLFGRSKINRIKKRYNVIVHELSDLLQDIYSKEKQVKEIHVVKDETLDLNISTPNYAVSSIAALNDMEIKLLREMFDKNEKLQKYVLQISPLIDELDSIYESEALSLRVEYSRMQDTLTSTYSRIRRVYNENIHN